MTEDTPTPIYKPPRPTTPPNPSFAQRFRAWRNRVVANDAFQKWSMRLPFVRTIARAKANKLFELTAGFVYSQVLFTCVELRLFEFLQAGPHEEATLGDLLELEPRPLQTLLQAAQGLRLVERDEDGLWWLDDLGVVLAKDDGIKAMIRHHTLLYRDLTQPTEALRNRGSHTEIAKFWAYPHSAHGDIADEHARDYSELMRVSQAAVAGEVLGAYSFSDHTTLVDVGGGHGTFLRAVGTAHPQLQLRLFDLPQVAQQGEDLLRQDGFGHRVEGHGGSFFDDPLPQDADCYSLIRVLYDHDDEAVMRLLANMHKTMPAGSRLIIAEPMGGEGSSEALIGAYFSYYLLAMGSGRCRTPKQIEAMLLETGFRSIDHRSTTQPLFASVVTALR